VIDSVKEPPAKNSLPDTDLTVKRSAGLLAVYWLLALALLYTLYFAKSLLMPIVVALLFSLLLSPLVTLFKRFYIPRTVSAIVLLAMIGGPFTLLAIELAEPSQKWLAQLPKLTAQLTEELDDLSLAMSPDTAAEPAAKALPAKKKGFSFFGLFGQDEAAEIEPEKNPAGNSALSARVMQGGVEVIVSVLGATPVVIAQFMTFIFLTLFLLIFGPRLFDSFIDIFPAEHYRQRPAVLIGKVQKELSRYILTVSIINTVLGIVTAGVLWVMGVDDAVLWGALVGLLNFAPFLGPIIAIGVLGLAGIAQNGMELFSLLPAVVYFGINLLESQFVTPAVLGRHMRLNPLILILWLFVWGWLWGPAGVLLAVPLLVCIKLAAGQLNILTRWVRLIETGA
jgi:predicted PurR-regulated permease PerM